MSYLLSSVQRQLRFSRQTRSLWTKLTATGSSIEECVQVSVDSLKDLPSKPDVCFVLASKSFSLNNYRQLATDIQSHIKPTVFLGGVVDRVAQLDHGISLLLGYNEQIVPFTIEDSKDRHKVRSIAVGRWGDELRIENDWPIKVIILTVLDLAISILSAHLLELISCPLEWIQKRSLRLC